MKKNILVLVSMAIILIPVIAGCDLVGGNSFSFHNGSDHDVTVTPDGQTSWEKFTLDPDEEHKVVIPDYIHTRKYHLLHLQLRWSD